MLEDTEYAGRLYRYKKSRFGKGRWKECWMVVLKRGKVLWYNDKQCHQLLHSVHIHNGVKMSEMAVKYYRGSAPAAPLDHSTYFIAIPDNNKQQLVHWFCTKTEDDLRTWIRAFSAALGKDAAFDAITERIRHSRPRPLLQRSASGNDDERLQRLGVSLSPEGNDRRRVAVDWGAIWEQVLKTENVSALKGIDRSQSYKAAKEVVANLNRNQAFDHADHTHWRSVDSSDSSLTWDLPNAPDDDHYNTNDLLANHNASSLVDEVMQQVNVQVHHKTNTTATTIQRNHNQTSTSTDSSSLITTEHF